MAQFEALAPQVAARLSRDLGITPQQAAGIVGALGYESAGLQAINERQPVVPGSRGGFGWAQWTGPRRQQFEAFAKHVGLDVKDPEANYQFLVHELTNTPEGAVLDAIRGTDDPKAAGRLFTEQFLRPGVPAMAKRDSWVERAAAAIFPSAEAAPMNDKLASDPLWQMLNEQPAAGGGREVSERLAADPVWQMLNQPGGTTQSRAEDGAVPATPEASVVGSIGAGAGKAVGDAVLGAQSLLGRGMRAVGIDEAGNWLMRDAAAGKARLQAENAPYAEANPVSNIAGQIGGSIAPGAGIASLLGRSLAALGNVARIGKYVEPLTQAITTGGFRAGGLHGLAGLGTRAAGGAISGAGIGAVYDPEHLGMAAGLGATIPIAGQAAYAGTRYAGNVGRALIDPFTQAGQQRIAANILNRAAAGGPVGANAAELVPGSIPTLAEATGNPGIATLQRSLRDVNPSPFVEREQANAAARLGAFEGAAGDASKLDFFRAARSATADDLYNKAIDGYTGETTPWIRGQITQLLKRPSITQARRIAQQWAIERGQKPDPAGSLRSMHDMKTALDDMIGKAVRDGEGGRAKALQQTKDQLVTVMEKMSPEYATARQTYAAMSEPINAMEVLQGLRLTDQYGNLTLAKVQNAIRSLQDRMARPGVDAAKSVSADQLGVLTSIRDDLLRGANINLGRSLGSNTAQNLVTQNMMAQILPGRLGDLVGRVPAGGVGSALGSGLGFLAGGPTGAVAGGVAGAAAGKIASGLLNGQNDAVQRALTGMLLNSQTGLSALQGAARPAAPFAQITPLQRLLYPSVTASAVNGLTRLGSPASAVHGR